MISWKPIWVVRRDYFVKACQMFQLSHRVGRVGPLSWESWAVPRESWATHEVCHITTKIWERGSNLLSSSYRICKCNILLFTTFLFKGLAYLQHLPCGLAQLSPQMRGEMGQPLGRVGPFSVFSPKTYKNNWMERASTSLKRCCMVQCAHHKTWS